MNNEFPATRHDTQIAVWLLCVCAAMFVMLVIGGATRLTHSGLSMANWDPLLGWVPPLSDADWAQTFDKYKQTPEFKKLNPNMDLEGFKGIFFLEYVHRVWGRLIGLIFLIPFIYFLIAGKINRALRPKLVIIFILGGLEGVLGWYMVKSGLVDNPHVSQYRLTAHLLAAFIIYAYIFWVAMGLLFPRQEAALYERTALRRFALAVTGLIAITVVSGGFVAGLKAGFAYNTFPLMAGRFIPAGYGMLSPFYLNFFDNIAAVQFDHRLLAEILAVAILGLWFYARRFALSGRAGIGFHLLLAMCLIQVGLGIATLLFIVPVWLAVTHQGGALVLFTVALFVNHALRKTRRI